LNEELQKLSPIINLTGLSLLIAVKAQGSKLWFDKKKLSFHELMNENVIDDKIQFTRNRYNSLVQRSYIKRHSKNFYKVTDKGREAYEIIRKNFFANEKL